MSLRGRHVLILEDEPIIGLALADQLICRGAVVHLADRLEEAAQLIGRERVDCAVLDVNVHGKLSYPIAEMLAKRAIPYVFATGYGDMSHPPAFAAARTLSKPYSIEEIATALG